MMRHHPRQKQKQQALERERTLFLLEYIRDLQLRRRIHVGLNKGEARNALFYLLTFIYVSVSLLARFQAFLLSRICEPCLPTSTGETVRSLRKVL